MASTRKEPSKSASPHSDPDIIKFQVSIGQLWSAAVSLYVCRDDSLIWSWNDVIDKGADNDLDDDDTDASILPIKYTTPVFL